MSDNARKTFKFCCKRLLTNQMKYFIQNAKYPEKLNIYCVGDCNNTFRLGDFTSSEGGNFFFCYNNWWYIYSLKTGSIEPFFPLTIFDSDPEVFTYNLQRHGLITDLGKKFLFAKITKEEYVSEAMITKQFNRQTMLDDFSMLMKCKMWWDCLITKKNQINHYKEMATNLINEST